MTGDGGGKRNHMAAPKHQKTHSQKGSNAHGLASLLYSQQILSWWDARHKRIIYSRSNSSGRSGEVTALTKGSCKGPTGNVQLMPELKIGSAKQDSTSVVFPELRDEWFRITVTDLWPGYVPPPTQPPTQTNHTRQSCFLMENCHIVSRTHSWLLSQKPPMFYLSNYHIYLPSPFYS